MTAKLTRRQLEVLSKLLDLYRQNGEPIHYTALAEHLGVSPVSAYEMLRVLEAHGMADAEHQRPEPAGGPGRPTVAFRPSLAAIQRLRTLTGGDIHNEEEWQQVKSRILQQIQNYQSQDLEKLLDKLLEHIPEEAVSLPNLANITTAILLNLDSIDRRDEANDVRKALSNRQLSVMAGLSALLGLGFSEAISERLYLPLGNLLLNRAGEILSALSTLSPERSTRLAALLREVSRM